MEGEGLGAQDAIPVLRQSMVLLSDCHGEQQHSEALDHVSDVFWILCVKPHCRRIPQPATNGDNGGRGGGIIKLTAQGAILLTGSVVANGETFEN